MSDPTGEWTCDDCRSEREFIERDLSDGITHTDRVSLHVLAHIFWHLGHQARSVEPAKAEKEGGL